MIDVKIVADSVNPIGNRLTSFILTYPRFIHSEVMTHRMFSRNAASSRAIPLHKMIDAISTSPAQPVFWGKNQKGMQALEELPPEEKSKAIKIWHNSCKRQIKYAKMLAKLDVHKQIANRLLEPFAHMTTLITATEWGNFFNLRAHPDAQPEFQELAYRILETYSGSIPQEKTEGEWHLPFSDRYMQEGLTIEELLKITTARAARISYKNFEGDIDHQKDYELHDRLANSGHWSPFEHAAKALAISEFVGNFRGFMQYRKMFQNENQAVFRSEQLLNRRRGRTNGK
jgi:thymidylate synthase ThyX